mmetsp:Transcript_21776/g.36417  ORF Transcript_21776/g.36417 Transcript_21776/m.36417 type:complete len:492 (+) Transcript_21776:72-1547(+)
MRGAKPTKFGQKDRSRGGCSPVMFCSWLLILMWMLFLIYCWQTGIVDREKVNEMVVEAETIINRTENSLRGRFHTLAYNGEHVSHPPVHPSAAAQRRDGEVHIVFSTDCSEYQDWQTLLLFHSAKVVGQVGKITRIASGCTDEKKAHLNKLYSSLYDSDYGAHYTPDFKRDAKTNKKYDFYNKPWGMKHWLEFAHPPIPENTFIALLDPDMVLVRPITTHIEGDMSVLVHPRLKKDGEVIDEISLGHPVAQTYGLGAPWTNDNHKKFNRGKICGEGSPCLQPNQRFGELHYSVGPPYIAHKADMLRIVRTWTTFVPRVYEGYPYLLAEMYAYSMAAAHEKLPHLQLDHYMVSNVDAGGEGWAHVDALPQVCRPPDENGIYYKGHPMPSVVHFCQGIRAGDFVFLKRRIPKNIFTCEHPLFTELPMNLGESTYKMQNGKKQAIKNARTAKRNSFELCIVYDALNKAMVHFKDKMCQGNPNTTYAKAFKLPVH